MSAQLYIADPTRSGARFRVKKFGFLYTVKGNFGDSVSGELVVRGDRLRASGVVCVSALTTGRRGRDKHIATVRQRDAHLRTADFFDTARFPEIALIADEVPLSAEEIETLATLTIKDVTARVPVKVKATRNDGTLIVEVEGHIDRRRFGLTPPSFFYDKAMVAAAVDFEARIVAAPASKVAA